jgi:predicted nucleic acid-binding protein
MKWIYLIKFAILSSIVVYDVKKGNYPWAAALFMWALMMLALFIVEEVKDHIDEQKIKKQ